jgi:hypothetical protein
MDFYGWAASKKKLYILFSQNVPWASAYELIYI